MNSQYPYAMLNDMPIGNPKFTYVKNLNGFFGFVYSEIIPPKKNILKNLILPYRNEIGEIKFSRSKFKGWYFSEELKYVEKLGYIIKPPTVGGAIWI